jgi:subtilisin
MLRKQERNQQKFTGRTLCMFKESVPSGGIIKKASTMANLKIASIKDYKSDFTKYKDAFKTGDGIYFDELGVMIVNPQKEESVRSFTTKSASLKNMTSEPERYVYAIGAKNSKSAAAKQFADDKIATWGVHATNVLNSPFSGKGIRIAVLDTGLFDKHPDFKKRKITLVSKVSKKKISPQDKDGHGTHCTGVSMGKTNAENLRYGVAHESEIFMAKVLDDDGRGVDGDIVAGINWAITNKCRIVSMSLGGEAEFGEEFSTTFENIARRAMGFGTIIIAAAGNESQRSSNLLKPVGHPANCPSIMAVAAIDNNLQIADFSCTSDTAKGAQIDIAAPGVGIFSSYIRPENHEFLDGTSMATPFVAGIAALYLQKNPNLKPLELWSLLMQKAKRLNIPSIDAGAGLVQAPN